MVQRPLIRTIGEQYYYYYYYNSLLVPKSPRISLICFMHILRSIYTCWTQWTIKYTLAHRTIYPGTICITGFSLWERAINCLQRIQHNKEFGVQYFKVCITTCRKYVCNVSQEATAWKKNLYVRRICPR